MTNCPHNNLDNTEIGKESLCIQPVTYIEEVNIGTSVGATIPSEV